jgi:FMN phosphatase YigB (HAD superfamily)
VPVKAVIFDFNRTIYDPETDQLTPGAKEVLDSLKAEGVLLFLIARGSEDRRKRIEELGLLPYFERVVVNEDKSANSFRSCSEQCPPGTEIFAVGDRVRREIRLANESGMTTIWYRSGKFANEEPQDTSEKPAFTISTLAQVRDLILGQKR